MVRRLSDEELTVLVTLEFANVVGSHIPKKQKDTRDRYEDALAVVRDLYIAELSAQTGTEQLPPELATLVSGRMPTLPRVWDLSETIRRVVVLAYSNAVAPYEIDTGGCCVALAAAGVALLAAGPIGIAMAGAAGAAGAAAITSGLAAFGPGGMVGGLAMLSSLAGTGGMVAAAAATARPGANAVVLDPTSIAIQVSIAHALKKVGEEFDGGLWERVTLAEGELSSQINRLESYSDAKSASLERLNAARDVIKSLLDYMKKHGLVPDAVVPAISDPDGDDDGGPETAVRSARCSDGSRADIIR
ncbi:hypothetical protein ACH46_13305 [Gordonia phthalatica]|uniref:Uncharacterized protein n=2 Tax=Gordonia phthalatica TaxID=1136941 RepID=A0A0N9MS36_9ACTN|nr:hypothetical protein ACH46_13305 [Gordonia phthalatica]